MAEATSGQSSQGGSEKAKNDGSKLMHVAHPGACGAPLAHVSGRCLVAAATLRTGAVAAFPPLKPQRRHFGFQKKPKNVCGLVTQIKGVKISFVLL